MKTLQYQLSSGNWVDVDKDRINEFLEMCVEFDSPDSKEDAIKIMSTGKKLRNDNQDWYSNCRMIDKDIQEKRKKDRLKDEQAYYSKQIFCKHCGQIGIDGQSPFTTMRGSGICDDCL